MAHVYRVTLLAALVLRAAPEAAGAQRPGQRCPRRHRDHDMGEEGFPGHQPARGRGAGFTARTLPSRAGDLASPPVAAGR